MNESELLPRARCEEVFGVVADAARSAGVRDIEVMVGAGAEALTRFANNAIHQNVAEESHHVSIRPVIDQRTARVTTNRLDPESIRAAVERAILLTRASEPNPEMLPLVRPAAISEVARYGEDTARQRPADRARAVAGAIRVVEDLGQTAAGIYSVEQGAEALLNTEGLFAYHCETLAVFSITAMAADSSGWAKASSTSAGHLDPEALARSAVTKARLSANPREIAAGAATVILEPAAVLDLTGQMFGDFSATAVADQRSFLTGRLGEPLFGENITIHDDVLHPLQCGTPFDGEGVPRSRLLLVERGVPKEIAWSRSIAHKAGGQPTGHGFPLPNELGEAPSNIVIEGGSATVDEMIASTGRGILVTRVWYIREVDPYEKVMTGMTRDGTFLVEDGRIVCGLRNLRFNQGLIEMLRSVETMSAPVRASGEESIDMVVPAMKVGGFQFTEVTKF